MRLASVIWLFLLGGLPAAPEAPPETPENSGPVFAVVLTSEQEDISPVTLDHMQQELEYILSPFQLRFQWRRGLHDRSHEPANLLMSVRLRGSCTTEGLSDATPSRSLHSLGHAEVSDGRILAYCTVDCEKVRTMIWPLVRRESFPLRQLLLGRALGRVLAHETYHILSGTMRHGDSTVTKAMVRPEELITGPSHLHPEDIDAIRAGQIALGSPRLAAGGDGR
jgi:hypothetical protein